MKICHKTLMQASDHWKDGGMGGVRRHEGVGGIMNVHLHCHMT